MKSLLRKKTPTDNVKNHPPSQYTRPPPTTETPLYARFASTKPAAQSLEKTRLVVSGPMPLGRPTRANLEADSRRKHEEENPSRGRLSSGRRVLAGPESQLDAREFQSSLERSSQDAPVVDRRLPIKARTACKSHFSVPIVPRRSPPLRHAILDDVHSLRTSKHLGMAAVPPSMVRRNLFVAFPWFYGLMSQSGADSFLTISLPGRAIYCLLFSRYRNHRECTISPRHPPFSRIAAPIPLSSTIDAYYYKWFSSLAFAPLRWNGTFYGD